MKQTTIQVVTNDDGDVYGAFKEGATITRLGAFRAIKKELNGWGIGDEVEISLDDLDESEFWETTGGQYDGWIWWSKPDKKENDFDSMRFLGKGWMYSDS